MFIQGMVMQNKRFEKKTIQARPGLWVGLWVGRAEVGSKDYALNRFEQV